MGICSKLTIPMISGNPIPGFVLLSTLCGGNESEYPEWQHCLANEERIKNVKVKDINGLVKVINVPVCR